MLFYNQIWVEFFGSLIPKGRQDYKKGHQSTKKETLKERKYIYDNRSFIDLYPIIYSAKDLDNTKRSGIF